MSYRTTRQADEDIIAVFVQGATQFGLAQAEQYHNEMAGIFALLAENPQMARLRHEFSPPVRIHPFQAHVIVYIEQDDNILIVRVLHGRQDWERQLLP